MKILTFEEGYSLISHLKNDYVEWYNSLDDKTDIRDWIGFVERSVHVNNEHNGSKEDFVFIAEDAILNLR